MVDEHLIWNDYIKYIDNEAAKRIGLLYRAKIFLNKILLLTLYFSLIQTYLNYAKLAWNSAIRKNLKKTTQSTKARNVNYK